MPSSGRFVRLSRLRKLSRCEQVAAVCYRIQSAQIEFLLVRTSGGERWTFPKGSAEPGLTHAQAAALEAFEEAGVHGRIEETAFTSYRRRDRGEKLGDRSAATERINAHLCEVFRLSPPKESGRDRTWFSIAEARQRLRQGRTQQQAAEFVRVIDRAVARIRQLVSLRAGERPFADKSVRATVPVTQDWSGRKDPLQQVKFDFSEVCGRMQNASFAREHLRRSTSEESSLAPRIGQRENLPCEILEFDSPKGLKLPN